MFCYLALSLMLIGCDQASRDIDFIDAGDSLAAEKFSEWGSEDSLGGNPIKSGIIYMVSTKPIYGSEVTRTIYFDDYGKLKRTETVTELKVGNQSVTTTQITIEKDGRSYKYDPEKKTGFVSKMGQEFNPTQIDFSKIKKIEMEEFGIKKVGTEEIAGKLCIIYTIDYPALGFKGRYSIWNSLPLREQFSTSDFGYEYVATRLVEDKVIPIEMFNIPKDIEFQDAASSRSIYSPAFIDTMMEE